MIALINRWESQEVDFVLAYPQAPLEYDIYMQLPKGVESRFGKKIILKLHKNLYSQKYSGQRFHICVGDHFLGIILKQPKVDDCVFYKGRIVILIRVDDLILVNKDNGAITSKVKLVKKIFKVDNIGNVNDYLEVKAVQLLISDWKIKALQENL